MKEQEHNQEQEQNPLVLNPLPEQPLPVPPLEFGPEDIPAPSYTERIIPNEEPETETAPSELKQVNRVSRIVFFFLFSALAAVLIILLASLFS